MNPEQIIYKHLNLITPEKAAELNIVAEAPIMVSPYVKNAEICPHCGAEYTPLIYSLRRVTRAQHFHNEFDRGSGIYVFPKLGIVRLGSLCGKGTFVEVRTIGNLIQVDKYAFKTEAVEILRVRMISFNRINVPVELTEGVLVHDNRRSGILLPISFEDAVNCNNEPYCNFKVSPEGELLFYFSDSSQDK